MKINRRTFGLLAGSSMTALKIGQANAQTTADPTLLTTTLTPFGAERAGSADGSIPAWTGGFTTLPAGWQSGQTMPDFFADEQPILVIDASNMAQHADKLTDGVKAMMTAYGFSIKVYPTHRTHSLPQEVYDNITKNVTRAKLLDPANPQNGLIGGFGGCPFPIPDTTQPLIAGAQIILNHKTKWSGYGWQVFLEGYTVSNGQIALAQKGPEWFDYPYYYLPNLANVEYRALTELTGPANLIGENLVVKYYLDDTPTESWELLPGQGRVRKAPEFSYDTPSGFADGVANFDEYQAFGGQLIEYDWKYLEKTEMYIPYNCNAMFLLKGEDVLKTHFPDPNVIRWELHRVWVVEATLRPGSRNVLARRRFFIDEDTWIIGASDAYDANDNLYHVGLVYNYLRPDAPGVVFGHSGVFNMQTGDYALPQGPFNQKDSPSIKFTNGFPDSTFDPENMAASSQY